MLSLLLDQILKGKAVRNTVVRLSFFVFQGILSGILMNDILRILYGDFDGKTNVEYGISGAVAVLPYVIPQLTLMYDSTNNIALGGGMALGTYMASRTESGKPLEVIQK